MNLSFSNFSLKKLRQRDITIIIIVLTVIMAVLWYFYMFRPTQARIAELNEDISRLNDQIRQGEAARDSLPQLEEDLALAIADREAFLRELPRESDVARLILALRESAAATGVTIDSFSQGRSNLGTIQDVRPVGFSIATTGNFPETMLFLDALEGAQRFTKVQQVGLSTSEDGVNNPELNANFDFTVFVYTGADAGVEQ